MKPVAIIGAGPAGIAAAIQLKRFNIPFNIFEKSEPGGLLLNANLVENYPGFPQGIPGAALASIMEKQLAATGVFLRREEVQIIKETAEGFLLQTDAEFVSCRILVMATGTVAKTIPLPGLDEPWPKTIHTDILRLRSLRQKVIAILGAGDAAFDYALSLSKKNQVHIFHRSSRIRALQLLVERCSKHPSISCFPDHRLESVRTSNSRLTLTFRNLSENRKFGVDHLVMAVGRTPCDSLLVGFSENRRRELVEKGRLHLVGDMVNGNHRQAAIAVGDGIRAAMKIYQKLEMD